MDFISRPTTARSSGPVLPWYQAYFALIPELCQASWEDPTVVLIVTEDASSRLTLHASVFVTAVCCVLYSVKGRSMNQG